VLFLLCSVLEFVRPEGCNSVAVSDLHINHPCNDVQFLD
jgi:hypothetical protein